MKTLPPLPKIGQLLKMYNVTARKDLGQNFLLDETITKRIAAGLGQGGTIDQNFILEIGPGPGSLSRAVLELGAKQFLAIEKDARFTPSLRQLEEAAENRFKVTMGDAMSLTESDLIREFQSFPSVCNASIDLNSPKKFQVIANLPFNVATPLLFKWLKWMARSFSTSTNKGNDDGGRLFSQPNVEMILMFQKEVAQRIVARPGTNEMSRISVLSQYICDTKILFHIPGSAFTPPPKVDASVVHFIRKPNLTLPVSVDKMETLARLLFTMRRKSLRGILGQASRASTRDMADRFISVSYRRAFGSIEAEKTLSFLNLSPMIRPAEMSLTDITNLGMLLDSHGLFSKFDIHLLGDPE